MLKSLLFAAAAAAALTAAAPSFADDFTPKAKGRWVVDLRVTDVAPDGRNPILTAAGAATGLQAKVASDVMPTLGISYFLTDHVALDLTLGTTTHKIKAVGPGVNVEVHDTWVLPPVITAQYHFFPKARFSPYVGTGPNAMLFYSGSDKNGFKVKVPSGIGWAAQVGADWAVQGRWTLNADVKKVWFETDAKINDGALKSKVRLDPWVASLGVGYRF